MKSGKHPGKCFCFLLVAAFCWIPMIAQESRGAAANTLEWMTTFAGKSSSDLVGDSRFKPTLRAWLPSTAPLPHTRDTADAAQDFMAQGQGRIQVNDNGLFANGCLPGACNVAGGWLWVNQDPRHPAIVLALLNPQPGRTGSALPFVLVVVGEGLTAELALPQPAQESLRAWLQTMKATDIADLEIETKTGKKKTALPAYLQLN